MTAQPKINSVAPWYGAKRKADVLAEILSRVGRPALYAEPFCGSCAVAFAVTKHAAPRTIIVNDINADLINLVRVISTPLKCSALWNLSQRWVFCEPRMRDTFEFLRSSPAPSGDEGDVVRAEAYLYLTWSNVNGFAGTTQERDKPRFAKRFTASGGDGATRLRRVSESIPDWHELVRHWTILSQCGIELVESKLRDHPEHTIYVDTPYHKQSRSGVEYVCEFTQEQHERVEKALRERFEAARVIVSHYDCEAIRELYADRGWSRFKLDTRKNSANSQGGGKVAQEVFYTRNIPNE